MSLRASGALRTCATATGQLLEPGRNARMRHNRAANTIQMEQLGEIRGGDLLDVLL